MAEERVDRARKMVRVAPPGIVFHVFASECFDGMFLAEIISPSILCTASPSFSSTLTVLTSPRCVCSTNVSVFFCFVFFTFCGGEGFTVTPNPLTRNSEQKNTR